MQGKFKYFLRDNLYAVLTIKLEVPPAQKAVAEAMGISKEELDNLTNQEFQSLLLQLGNTEEV